MNGGIFLLPFTLRIFLFFIIWSFIIFSKDQQTSVFLFFFCAFSLSIYFLVPIMKRTFLFMILLQAITIFYGFFYEDNLILLFLLLSFLYSFEMSFYIAPQKFQISLVMMGTVLLLCFVFILKSSWMEIASIFLPVLLLSIILGYFNGHYFQSLHKSHLYEQLLGEYRKVKRYAVENEKTVRVEERARIAREMHDSVGHKLTALSMQIEMLLMKEDHKVLRSMKDIVNESLEETRKAVRALTMEDIEGIPSVIQLIRKLESESQLRIHFTTKQGTLSVSLSNPSSIVLYRVLQESLTNAMKYGTSKEVFITLGLSPIEQLTFEIMNKCDSPKPFHEGFGLRNMRERVEKLGGRLHFYRLDGHFIVEGTMPVEERDK